LNFYMYFYYEYVLGDKLTSYTFRSVPRVRTCFGSRSFSVAAPTMYLEFSSF